MCVLRVQGINGLSGGGSGTSGVGRVMSDWQTLVLFAVNLSELDVNINMSNIMGNTV